MKKTEQEQHYGPPKNSRILPFAKRYAVTEDGRVFSLNVMRYLKIQKTNKEEKKAYLQVNLTNNEGKQRFYKVHRLVAFLFVPNGKNLPEVGHKDHNKQHNHYTNLYWTTHKDNIQYSYDTGARKTPTGEAHWNYGKQWDEITKAKMSEEKMGEKHPKFKGWYIWQGERYASCQQLADKLQIKHPVTILRMLKKGQVGFEPVTAQG